MWIVKPLCVCRIPIPTILGLFTPPIAPGTSVAVVATPVPLSPPLRTTLVAFPLPLPAIPLPDPLPLPVGPKPLTSPPIFVSLTDPIVVSLPFPVQGKPV